MTKIFLYLHALLIVTVVACKSNKENAQQSTVLLTAKESVRLTQLIYKDTIEKALEKYAPGFEAVFAPQAVNGNYAVIVKNKKVDQYALVVRGSVMQFSNEGFQNFILQDFNIFRIKEWKYTDTISEAYISNGAWIGFQNLLLLKDKQTGLGLKDFVEKKIPAHSTLVITGHSLGGNLAYPLASYLKHEISAENKINMQLITFGAPAVGNAAFVQDIEEKFPDAERYACSKDIAPMFPDLESMHEVSKSIGLDSVLQLGNINISGVDTKLNTQSILAIANEVLEKTNVINKTNKYVQSQKHLRRLFDNNEQIESIALTTDAIFKRAYECHKVDLYAKLLGVEEIK